MFFLITRDQIGHTLGQVRREPDLWIGCFNKTVSLPPEQLGEIKTQLTSHKRCLGALSYFGNFIDSLKQMLSKPCQHLAHHSGIFRSFFFKQTLKEYLHTSIQACTHLSAKLNGICARSICSGRIPSLFQITFLKLFNLYWNFIPLLNLTHLFSTLLKFSNRL